MANDLHADRILALLAIFLSPFASLLLSRWFNAREVRQRARIADSGEDVSIFQAHLAAFRLRVEQLEAAEREAIEDAAELRALLDVESKRCDSLEDQNGRLLRENYRLREELDKCERRQV